MKIVMANLISSGNTNLVYSIIRSKVVFYQLANLPEESYQLTKPGVTVVPRPLGGIGEERRRAGCVCVCV